MWRAKLILNAGETLKFEESQTKGFMGEKEIDLYSVVRSDGTKAGTVSVSDHTAVRGFRRTISVLQRDTSGKTIVDVQFNPS